MRFSTIPNFGLNRSALPLHLGVLRLLAVLATLATIAQYLVPVGARYIFNGGRISYSNEPDRLSESLLPWPVLSVPAWLTITTGLIAIVCASAYLLLGGYEISDDIPFMTMTPFFACAGFPFLISTFEPDTTGIIWTPEPGSYPIGWHWIISPFAVIILISGIIAATRMKRLSKERRQRIAERRAQRNATQESAPPSPTQ